MITDLADLLREGPVTLTLPSQEHAKKAGHTLRPGLEALGIRARFTRAANTVTIEALPAL